MADPPTPTQLAASDASRAIVTAAINDLEAMKRGEEPDNTMKDVIRSVLGEVPESALIGALTALIVGVLEAYGATINERADTVWRSYCAAIEAARPRGEQ